MLKCLECGKFIEDMDLQICYDCTELFDLDRLWAEHDADKLDALDFNESNKMRERFRTNKQPR
jgi:hypothetical protein